MAGNTTKITEIIDERAFAEWNKFLTSLEQGQIEMSKMVQEIVQLNKAIGSAGSMKDLKTQTEGLTKSMQELEDLRKKLLATEDKLAKSEARLLDLADKKLKSQQAEKVGLQEAEKLLNSYSSAQNKAVLRQAELRRELEKLTNAYKQNKNELSPDAVEKYEHAVATLKEELRKSGVEVKQFARGFTTAEDSINGMEAELARLRTEYSKLTKEQRANDPAAKEMLENIQKLDAEFVAARRSMGVFTDKVGEYERGLRAMPTPIQDVTKSLQDLSGEDGKISFKGLISGLANAAKAGLAFIMTPIGATIAAIAAAVQGARMWYQYNKDLAEATKLTMQLTGANADLAKSLRSEVGATAEAFGKEYNETLRAANALSKEFGITVSEANDLIQIGFTRGADASGDFLDNIREYSTQMQMAGLSAKETIAILTVQQKEGIFSDKGVDTIKEANIRIREMAKSTRTALQGIGIDADEVQSRLISGQATTFEIVQEIAQKMGDFSEASQEVGTVLADVFGGAGEDAGLRFIKILKDINTEQEMNLENFTEAEKATIRQLQASEELKKELASLFDITGGGFETMIADLKVIATELLVDLIQGVKDAYDWFVELYNASSLVRGAIQGIGLVFVALKNVIDVSLGLALRGIRDLSDALAGALSLDFDQSKRAIKRYFSDTKKSFVDNGNDIAIAFSDAINETINGQMKKISGLAPVEGATGGGTTTKGAGGTVGDKASFDKANNERAKAEEDLAKRILKSREDLEKRLLELQRARLEREKMLQDELAGYALDSVNDERKALDERLNALQDYFNRSEEALETEKQIALTKVAEMNKEAANLEAEARKEQNVEIKANLITEAETLRQLALIEQEKTNEVLLAKTRELEDKKLELAEKTIKSSFKDRAEWEAIALEENYVNETKILAEQYKKKEIDEKTFLEKRAALQKKYAKESLEAQIKDLETLRDIIKANGGDTADLEKQLAKLRIEQSKLATDAIIDDLERIEEADKKLRQQRVDNALFVLDTVSSFADKLTGFYNALSENQLVGLEKEREINEQREADEIARIETSTLNEEQKEARKFAVQQKYAQLEEQNRIKQNKIKQKQAKADKANAVMQATISTAMGVATALGQLNIPLAAIIGALGAIEIATILATKIPAFYKGTMNSPEGLAKVGEKGTELMITPSGDAMLTPAKETLTYLEKGTKIFTAGQTKKILEGQKSLDGMHAHYNIDLGQLVNEQRNSTRELKKAFKDNASKTFITKKGLHVVHSKNSNFNSYLRRNGL